MKELLKGKTELNNAKQQQQQTTTTKATKRQKNLSYEGQGLGRVYVEASFRQGKGPVSLATLLEKALVGGWGLGSS